MKKFFAAGLAALGLILASQHEAQAWTKFSVGAGVWLNYEGGNNNLLWGAARGGQVPGYPTDVYQGGFGKNQGDNQYPHPPISYPYSGGGYSGDYGHANVVPMPHAPSQQSAPSVPSTPQGPTQAVYYGYQPSTYYAPQTNYYQYPTQGYGYGSYQVPSYWYGR